MNDLRITDKMKKRYEMTIMGKYIAYTILCKMRNQVEWVTAVPNGIPRAALLVPVWTPCDIRSCWRRCCLATAVRGATAAAGRPANCAGRTQTTTNFRGACPGFQSCADSKVPKQFTHSNILIPKEWNSRGRVSVFSSSMTHEFPHPIAWAHPNPRGWPQS